MSDEAKYSHYPFDHEYNKDVQIAGRIESDMTFLKKENKIQLLKDEYGSISKAKPHYRVELEISAELNGMLLEYSAKWTGPGGKL